MFRHKPGERHGEIKAEGHIPTTFIGETVDLFFRFSPTLTEEDLRVFQSRGINRYETVGSETPFKALKDGSSGNLRRR
jgi:hypothetical protein